MKEDGYLWQPDETWCAAAAHVGSLPLLQWLRAKHVPWDYRTPKYAVEGGHLDVFRWCHSQGCAIEGVDVWAAHRGDIRMLTWCRDNGVVFTEFTHDAAADIGIMEWLRARGCPFDAQTPARAAQLGSMDRIEWSTTNSCPFDRRVWDWCDDGRDEEYNPVWLWCKAHGEETKGGI